ncbi:MAG: hypothetical protein ACI4LT_02120 [Treponema sp.]
MSKFIQNNKKSLQSFQAEKIIINSENQPQKKSLPDIINSHPVIIYCGIAIVAFGMGFGAKTGIENAKNQELVTKNTYTLNKDIEKEYISIAKYTELETEKEQYKLKNLSLEKENVQIKNELNDRNSHDEWVKRYDKLVQERLGFENQLNNLNNLSTGIRNNSEDSYKTKKDELIRKIQSRDEQIKILLEKI